MNVAKHVHQQAGRIEGCHGSQVAVLQTDGVTASHTEAVRHPPPLPVHHISPGMTFLLAACCGLIAAGSYFAQPLSTLIGRDLNLPPAVAGLIVTVSQLGYVVGLLLLAPLGDLVENRRLLLCMLGGSLLSLIVAAMAPIGAAFLSACFGIGVSSIAVQLLVTLASFMSDPKRRGDVVGNVTSGMLIGVLLAYPHALKRHSEDKCQDHGNPGCRSCAVGRQRRRFYLEASACFGQPYRWSCVVITASNRMALRFSDSSAE